LGALKPKKPGKSKPETFEEIQTQSRIGQSVAFQTMAAIFHTLPGNALAPTSCSTALMPCLTTGAAR